MSKKKWLTIGIGVFVCVCIAGIGLLAVTFFNPALFNPLIPVYEYEITPSAHDGYSRYTLTRGNVVYVSDYEEYGLSTGGSDHQIGQTPLGGRIIEISGQKEYVVLFDFMSPLGVFRTSQTPPFDWRVIKFTEMQLYPIDTNVMATPAAPKVSKETALIEAALSPMRGEDSSLSPDQANGAHKSYALYLYSDQLYGMWYAIGVFVDESEQVYVAENVNSKEWFPASETFAEWLQ